MKHILGIVGSPRRNGNTHLLVSKLLEGAESEGATVETVFLKLARGAGPQGISGIPYCAAQRGVRDATEQRRAECQQRGHNGRGGEARGREGRAKVGAVAFCF